MKTAPHVLAVICFAVAVIVVGIGLAVTRQLIQLYGESVSPLNLAAQAAVLWLPLAIVLAVCGYVCLSRAR